MIGRLKPKSEFSQNVLTLMTGTTIAQAIPIAISPILTRIYTPEDFGVYALYMSIASIIAVAATGRYELAIMLPKKDSDAINIVALSILITFFVSFISLIIVFVFNSQITNLLNNPEISNWLYFIPITVLLTGIYQSFNYWSNRKKQYKRLAISRIVQSSATSSVNISMGFGEFVTNGLIVGNFLGQTIATSILTRMMLKEDSHRIKELKKTKMIALILKYIKFPKYNLPNAVIDGFRLLGISLLIAKFFTTATLGQFSLAWKMLQMPMGIIGGSLSQVFFQKVSNAKKTDLYRIVVQFTIKASFIATPMFLIIYFFAVDIFKFVFGENWELAGKAASTMAPWLFLNFLLWKRVDRAILAIEILVKKYQVKNIKYFIVGEGVEKLNLEKLVQEKNLNDFVIFVGAVNNSDVKKYLNIADVFISTYDSSNVGNPLLEAIRANKIIFTLNNGDTKDWIKHNENGFIYDIDNNLYENMARDLNDLIKNDILKEKIICNIKKTEKEKLWTWDERMKTEVLEVKKLLNDN